MNRGWGGGVWTTGKRRKQKYLPGGESGTFKLYVRQFVCLKNVWVCVCVFLSLNVCIYYIYHHQKAYIKMVWEYYFIRRLTHNSPSCRLQIASEVCHNLTEIFREWVRERIWFDWLDEISFRGYVPLITL